MSSSHPRRAPTKHRELNADTLLPCPECGAKALSKCTADCRLLDGTLVHNLTRYHCSVCGSNVFDKAAMQEIRRQRSKLAIVNGKIGALTKE